MKPALKLLGMLLALLAGILAIRWLVHPVRAMIVWLMLWLFCWLLVSLVCNVKPKANK